jgi:hypothetical protein
MLSALREWGDPVSQLALFISMKPLLMHTAVQGSLHPEYWVQMVEILRAHDCNPYITYSNKQNPS